MANKTEIKVGDIFVQILNIKQFYIGYIKLITKESVYYEYFFSYEEETTGADVLGIPHMLHIIDKDRFIVLLQNKKFVLIEDFYNEQK